MCFLQMYVHVKMLLVFDSKQVKISFHSDIKTLRGCMHVSLVEGPHNDALRPLGICPSDPDPWTDCFTTAVHLWCHHPP